MVRLCDVLLFFFERGREGGQTSQTLNECRMLRLLLLWSISICSLGASRVSVDIFYETLCPYCRQFISNQLLGVVQTELAQHIALKLYPYGNAHTAADGSLVCQHGTEECELNTLEACALFEYPHEKTVHFIACLEESNSNLRSCSETILGPEAYNKLNLCKKGPKGERYMKVVETQSRAQNYDYVPWVLIDGIHEPNAQRNLFQSICEHLKNQPDVCSNRQFLTAFMDMAASGVCYKNSK